MAMEDANKAIIYVRGRNEALERQEQMCLEYAATCNVEIVDSIFDDDETQFFTSIEGLDIILDNLTAKGANTVILTSLDRLTRNLGQLLGILKTLDDNKIKLMTAGSQNHFIYSDCELMK